MKRKLPLGPSQRQDASWPISRPLLVRVSTWGAECCGAKGTASEVPGWPQGPIQPQEGGFGKKTTEAQRGEHTFPQLFC